MTQARFSIGIDLGTTNSAMAYAPLQGDAGTEVFAVPQWETLSSIVDAATLPSFLYLPDEAAAGQLQGRDAGVGEWVVGRLARAKAGDAPGRVAHSAKSWLCHHAVDRSAAFLPWGSGDLGSDAKISPIRAAALVLNAMRAAWDDRFAASGTDFRFDAQDITVTVPASFDAVAQRLTLQAAKDAGFPHAVRLLEEPQAAFYRWLELHEAGGDLWDRLPETDAVSHHVLVVDIGGGTSDFSLFELRPRAGSRVPDIKRTAVSEHILLGGDNMDLAIAHLSEPRLRQDSEPLSATQWEHLVARCRDLKERALSGEGPADEAFPVSIPGRGSGLIGGTLSARLARVDIEKVLLDGFFPECAADHRPARKKVALKEWGLPYAADSAVTHHLAGFLSGRPGVDAVLFNGGALYPQSLRDRIRREIGKWQHGPEPVVLDNSEPDLAVARGAAQYGKILHLKTQRIEAGAARAIFLEIHRQAVPPDGDNHTASLVCVLPRDAAPGQAFEIGDLGLELRINRPVRFQTYSSTRHGKIAAGDIVDMDDRGFSPLPPLETVAKVEGGGAYDPHRTVPVTLTATLNELGLLQVSCWSSDPTLDRSWPLEFNLRPHEQGGAGPGVVFGSAPQAEANVPAQALEAGRARVKTLFGQPLGKRDKLTATRLLKSLEDILASPKGDWNWVTIRALWPALEASMDCRGTSIEHEEAWLILAGFFLRPGFGAPLDDARMDGVWRLRDAGLRFPGKRIKLQEYILWRRLAGGLTRERQERVLVADLDTLRRQKNPPAELIRLAGSLERIGHEIKTELIDRFLVAAVERAVEHTHCAPYLAALGLLLNRSPLYAGPETVVSPDLVDRAYRAFSDLDWADPELAELQTLFMRAGRVIDNRGLDVAEPVRNRIARKLEKCGVAPQRTAKLKDFMPVERSERIGLYGEALPPGLILSDM